MMFQRDMVRELVLAIVFSSLMVNRSIAATQNNQRLCSNDQLPLVSVINDIGSRISHETANHGNVLFSPVGLSMTLGMAFMAARGRTAEQMDRALGFRASNMTNKQVQQGFLQLSQSLSQSSTDATILKVANALFNQVGMNIPQAYRKEIFKIYDSPIHAVDFAREPMQVMSTINEWASRKTMNAVQNFITEPLPSETEILLANALYFKGTWKVQFPVPQTYRGYFYSNGKDTVVSMMTIAMGKFRYLKDDANGYKFLELPYKGGEVVMILALPLDFDKSPDLTMTSEFLCRLDANLRTTKLERVAIPKFRFEYSQSVKDSLQAMGMRDAFQSGVANFTNMRKNVHISDIMQKAIIDVNEEGSEASAVSGILIVPVSFREVDEFVANHPFSFHIVHKKSGVVLFTGKITNI